ncbi:hypothetical protein HRF87_22430 [Bacillus sp. CRN 9]|nr:hypothetical protein [Bacillus sp. CRN 9]
MGFLEGLIALAIILIISFIFAAIVSSFAHYGEKEPGIWVMCLTFIGSSVFGIWVMFFV